MGSIAWYWSQEGLLLTSALCDIIRMHYYSTTMLILVCLSSLCYAGSTPTHQLTKRAATVTYTDSLPETIKAAVNAVVSLALVSVIWFSVAPVFGLTVLGTRRSSSSSQYSDYYPTHSYYTSDYWDPASQYENYYYAQGRSLDLGEEGGLKGSLPRAAREILSSIDWVEAGLSLAGVKDESCRMKTVCEWEQAAYSNSILRLGIHTINSGLPGLDKYSGAVNAGLRGEDCNLLYSQCQNNTQQQHIVTNNL